MKKKTIKTILKMMESLSSKAIDHKKLHEKHLSVGMKRMYSCEECSFSLSSQSNH